MLRLLPKSAKLYHNHVNYIMDIDLATYFILIFTYILSTSFTLMVGLVYNFLYGRQYKNAIINKAIKYLLPFSFFIIFIIPHTTLIPFSLVSFLLDGLVDEYVRAIRDLDLMMFFYLYSLNLSYIIGSIPFGFLLTKCFAKKDVRDLGSGNTGATNVLRVAGKYVALVTFLCDFLKSFIPLIILINIMEVADGIIMLSSIQLILGHMFPLWLRFKGGKGVATTIGIYWAYSIYLGIAATFTWILIFALSRYSSLASIIMVLVTPIFSILLYDFIPLCTFHIFTLFLIALLIILRHHKNIRRLIQGVESKIELDK